MNFSFKHYISNITRLDESFGDAQIVFSRTNDANEVKATLEKFRKLAQQNKLSGDQKDITKWIKRPFSELKQLVQSVAEVLSKRELKTLGKKDSVKLTDTPEWLVIAPLTTEASQYYGKGTKWCTSGKQNNYFHNYFINDNIVLIYFISKQSAEKYAIAAHPDLTEVECFDAADEAIEIGDIITATNLPVMALIKTAIKHPDVKNAHAKHFDNEIEKLDKTIKDFLTYLENLQPLYNYPSDTLDQIDDKFTNIDNIIIAKKTRNETEPANYYSYTQKKYISGSIRHIIYHRNRLDSFYKNLKFYPTKKALIFSLDEFIKQGRFLPDSDQTKMMSLYHEIETLPDDNFAVNMKKIIGKYS